MKLPQLPILNNSHGLIMRIAFGRAITLWLLQFVIYLDVNAQMHTASFYENHQNINGNYNAGFGFSAMTSNNAGGWNTAAGNSALNNNGAGHWNTAVGFSALMVNQASGNTATGYMCLKNNTTGSSNAACGYRALHSNTTGGSNVANGYLAGDLNTSGSYNVAVGYHTLRLNQTGSHNVAIGHEALYANTGQYNTAVGGESLNENTNGVSNTALGVGALDTNTSGDYNTGLGMHSDISLATANFSTAIDGVVNASYKIGIGSVLTEFIEGEVPYSVVSDGRFKFNVNEMGAKGIDFIKRLRAVQYNFDAKKFQQFVSGAMGDEVDAKYRDRDFKPSTTKRHSGFIAQEVEKAATEIGYNFSGVRKPENGSDNYGLSYELLVVPLVKAVQEQQAQIDNEQKGIDELLNLVRVLRSSTPKN